MPNPHPISVGACGSKHHWFRFALNLAIILCVLGTSRGAWPQPHSSADALMPKVFGEGVISTVDDEIGGSFSLDGREFYFVKQPPSTTGQAYALICVSRLVGNHWTEPVVLKFSGSFVNTPPKMAPDGKRMYFASTRPVKDLPEGGLWIWYVERQAEGWSDPKPLPSPINSAKAPTNIDPSVAEDGTLYFGSARDATGLIRIFRSRLVDGVYQEPELLGPEINFPGANVYQPHISLDQRFLIFGAARDIRDKTVPLRKLPGELVAGGQPYPRTDLYVSEYKAGAWTPARHLEHGINSPAEDEYPFLSPDGKTLFFSSERSDFTVPLKRPITYDELDRKTNTIFNGHANVYSISAEALELSK
jgi:hypothetical protein